MYVFRIAKKKYAHDISGTGAAQFGGRWNHEGTPVLYTGATVEIALLEIVVHTPPMMIPQLELLKLEIPDDSIMEMKIENLPKNWSNHPAPTSLANLGESWVSSQATVALKVPSSISQHADIYVLNCRHPRYHEVTVISKDPFHFDPRLRRIN